MSKEKAPAFQFYPGDWLSSTKITLMTPAEEGAYIRLLCHAWQDPKCSLPDDDELLAFLSRLGPEWYNGAGERVKKCFKRTKGKRLYNERLKKEREKQNAWREKSKLGGMKSGELRRNKDLEPKGGSQMVQTNEEPKGNSSSLSSSSTSVKDKRKDEPPYEEIIKDLNQVLDKDYRAETQAIRKLIKARWNEGATLDDFRNVHRKMKKLWKDDPDMAPYLRPHTLYTGKFEAYRNVDIPEGEEEKRERLQLETQRDDHRKQVEDLEHVLKDMDQNHPRYKEFQDKKIWHERRAQEIEVKLKGGEEA